MTVADGCNPSWIRGGSERPVGVAAKDAAACEVPETKTEKQYINALLKSLICAYVKDQSEAQMFQRAAEGQSVTSDTRAAAPVQAQRTIVSNQDQNNRQPP